MGRNKKILARSAIERSHTASLLISWSEWSKAYCTSDTYDGTKMNRDEKTAFLLATSQKASSRDAGSRRIISRSNGTEADRWTIWIDPRATQATLQPKNEENEGTYQPSSYKQLQTIAQARSAKSGAAGTQQSLFRTAWRSGLAWKTLGTVLVSFNYYVHEKSLTVTTRLISCWMPRETAGSLLSRYPTTTPSWVHCQ